MSVTLRLQGLSNRASSCDIRKFFSGLDIPEGGVHIIGGPGGEAFVDVATWDNAYQALQMSGQKIRDSMIQISVVSSEEKQQALENCQKVKDFAHGRNGTHEEKSNEGRNARSHSKGYFLRADICDFEPTPTDIRQFFEGIDIQDIAFTKDDSSKNVVAIIMFGNRADATEGYNRFKNSKILRVMWSSSKEWLKYGGKLDNDEEDCISSISGNSRRITHSRSPRKLTRSPRRHSRSHEKHLKSSRRRSRSPRRRSRSSRRYSRSPRRHSRSPRRRTRSPRRHSRSPRKRTRSPRRRSRSPRRRSRSPQSSSRTPPSYTRSPQNQSEEKDSTNSEFHVRLMNLSYRAKRDDVKKLFHNHVRDDNIVFVYDERGRRTREGFATFTSEKHYKEALTLDKVMFKGHKLYISLISKSKMQKLLSSKEHCSGYFQAYVYLRNFSPNVTKNDIKEFFVDFSLNEDDIFLLHNDNNTCPGDVLVKLSSLEETAKAEKLDRTMFKDKRIPVKVVYADKVASFLQSNGLHMMMTDVNECVTQEDLPSEDEDNQENDVLDDEPIEDMDTPDDEEAVQEETPPECVSQADD